MNGPLLQPTNEMVEKNLDKKEDWKDGSFDLEEIHGEAEERLISALGDVAKGSTHLSSELVKSRE
jgi:hypothetical protein